MEDSGMDASAPVLVLLCAGVPNSGVFSAVFVDGITEVI